MVLIWTALVGLLFVGSLVLAFWGIPQIIKEQLHKQTELEQGTDQWDRFVELPFPIDFAVRFFNVTNSEDVLYKNATPKLQETEPYVYKMKIKKRNIRFDSDEEDSVTYDRQMTFEFDDSGTTKETDEVIITNAILFSALQLVGDVERIFLAGCIEKLFTPFGMGTVFIKNTVRTLLFDGIPFSYENQTGYACKIIRNKMIKIIGGIRVIEQIDGEGEGNGYLKFSFFDYKTDNYTTKKEKADGVYTVNRGIKDMTQLGNIMRWNGSNEINIWGSSLSKNNDTCKRVAGTDSTIYKPRIAENEELEIFNTDICRTVKLIYKNSDESYQGIKGYRYEASPTLFRPATILPEDDCYCTKATKDISGKDNCYLDGAFDFKPCLGAPILVTQPHFLNADQHYRDGVEGLNPDASKHNIYLLVEPNTGTPLTGRKRIQLNVNMRNEPLISAITPKNMTDTIMPILWLEEGVNLPEKYVDLVNDQYFKAVKITDGVKYALIGLFAALLLVFLFFVWRKEYFKKKST